MLRKPSLSEPLPDVLNSWSNADREEVLRMADWLCGEQSLSQPLSLRLLPSGCGPSPTSRQ